MKHSTGINLAMGVVLVSGLLTIGVSPKVQAHGDVVPQPVNTDSLPDIAGGNENWVSDNPYRKADPKIWREAVKIGSSGFNQNCARCHGLGAISGGLAPDLRYLEANPDGDAWFQERFKHGVNQDGINKMPAFAEILGQKAGWAIKSYVESRPGEGAIDPFTKELAQIRDRLAAIKGAITGDQAKQEASILKAIADKITTASGFPIADSIALEAYYQLSSDKPNATEAANILTVGLSVAK